MEEGPVFFSDVLRNLQKNGVCLTKVLISILMARNEGAITITWYSKMFVKNHFCYNNGSQYVF